MIDDLCLSIRETHGRLWLGTEQALQMMSLHVGEQSSSLEQSLDRSSAALASIAAAVELFSAVNQESAEIKRALIKATSGRDS